MQPRWSSGVSERTLSLGFKGGVPVVGISPFLVGYAPNLAFSRSGSLSHPKPIIVEPGEQDQKIAISHH